MLVMVAGFAFYDDLVFLVQKIRPTWQSGLWNGIGGKAERDETPLQAMVREFQEETGVRIENWDRFCSEIGPGYIVHFFRTTLAPQRGTEKWNYSNDAGERLAWTRISEMHSVHARSQFVGNLHWLVPLARDPRGLHRPVQVEAVSDIKMRPTWW